MCASYPDTVERWGIFEVSCPGRTDGNPFDYAVEGRFTGTQEDVAVEGFYDGGGVYKARFMPSFEGEYRFTVRGTFSDEVFEGRFTAGKPSEGNHGPVRVVNGYHFAYEDAAPYYPVGTTCYVWALQSDERIAETLESLRESGFNKLRFCVFPKHYDYNLGEPRSYPYEGTPMDSSVLTKENFFRYTGKSEGNHWDFSRFNPEHIRHLERCISELQRLGVEADLIMMHPYDRWGFSTMSREQTLRYWRYAVARFASDRNVWWSLANEYDLMPDKTLEDWESYADLLCRKDPYRHLRSIHNCRVFYDFSRPWVTHCSIQRTDTYRTAENVNEWRARWGKPVVLDEIMYEGDLPFDWGNITGEEMLRRFWEAFVRGGYPGHGETLLNPEEVLWWSHGGRLRGESWKRMKFLLGIMKQTPGYGMAPGPFSGPVGTPCGIPERPEDAWRTGYRIHYFSFMRPAYYDIRTDGQDDYRVEVIDSWNMTVEDRGIHRGNFRVVLPGRPYMAIRVWKDKAYRPE